MWINKTKRTNLPDDRRLEDDQHDQGEDRVVPVFIQAPKSNTKDLEDEEWSDGMFLEEFRERRFGNVEPVHAISSGGRLCLLLTQSSRFLEFTHRQSEVGRILDLYKDLLVRIPHVLFLLEEEEDAVVLS